MAALFGWQGFSLLHPDDWAPVSMNGDRSAGYVRLASPRQLSLQVRWAPAERADLEGALDRYLRRLARDAHRRKRSFTQNVDGLRYRYRGEADGDGALLATDDGRIAFLEAVGESATARSKTLGLALDSFQAQGAERWAVLGLDFTLPEPARVEKKEFLSGRTALSLVHRRARIVAERWGLAESLLAQMSLQTWAEGRLGRGWSFVEEERGLRGSKRAMLRHDDVLIQRQPELNQIALLRVTSRTASWRPQWDWLN